MRLYSDCGVNYGEADTEELRKAVVHYRALFDELLEVRETKEEAMPLEQSQT
jgi:hypothetical protein